MLLKLSVPNHSWYRYHAHCFRGLQKRPFPQVIGVHALSSCRIAHTTLKSCPFYGIVITVAFCSGSCSPIKNDLTGLKMERNCHHVQSCPKASYVADWDDLPAWKQETDADIFEAIEGAALQDAAQV